MAATVGFRSAYEFPVHVVSYTENLGEVTRGEVRDLEVELFNPTLSVVYYQTAPQGCSDQFPPLKAIGRLSRGKAVYSFSTEGLSLGAGQGKIVVTGTHHGTRFSVERTFTYEVVQ